MFNALTQTILVETQSSHLNITLKWFGKGKESFENASTSFAILILNFQT